MGDHEPSTGARHDVRQAREDVWIQSRPVVRYFLIALTGLLGLSGNSWFLTLRLFALFPPNHKLWPGVRNVLSTRHPTARRAF
jgi:hypothetical protein